jgi:hypothetical protein
VFTGINLFVGSHSCLPRQVLATTRTTKYISGTPRERPEGSISLWRRGNWQVHVDGPLSRNATAEHHSESSSALSCIYDRCPQATTCLQDCSSAWWCGPCDAHIQGYRAGVYSDLSRRVPGDRYSRCYDLATVTGMSTPAGCRICHDFQVRDRLRISELILTLHCTVDIQQSCTKTVSSALVSCPQSTSCSSGLR